MKMFLSIVIVAGILLLAVFIPVLPKPTVSLPENTIFYYHRVGGVAGFFDKISVTNTGQIIQELPTSVKKMKMNDSEFSDLEKYISNHEYVSFKVSIYELIRPRSTKESSRPDSLSTFIQIRDGSKTREVQEDEFIISLLKSLGV
jgi:hypothetical protein